MAQPSTAATFPGSPTIPQPPKYGPLGNLLSMDRQNPLQGLMRLADQFGPIFRLEMAGRSNLFISSAELVADACDESRFDKNIGAALRIVRSFTGDGLFTAYTHEENWEKAHRILLPSFNQKAMQAYHPMMLDLAVQLVQKWLRLNPEETVDVADDMTRLTLDTIGLCGFNYRFNSFYRDRPHPFITAMVSALDEAMSKLGRIKIQDRLMVGARKQLMANIESMNKMVDQLIAERKASGEQIDDLLGHMLSGVDPETGQRLSDENIRYQIITFLIAGHETTSGLLSFAIYYLLKDPAILAKAREEADRVLTDPLPTYRQVRELKYTRMILSESLRLWPTAPALALYAKKDLDLGGRYPMKKGAGLVVITPKLHRDTSVWGPDAERFRPERFANPGDIPSYAYKPFGNGQRACIGQQFAMQEATLVLGMVVKHFDWIDCNNYQLKVRETLTLKPDNLRIQVRPRKGVNTNFGTSAAQQAPAASAAAVAAAGSQPSAAATGAPMLVLYGSNMGTAESLARQLADAGARRGLKGTAAPLDSFVRKLPTDGPVVIVTASYNGHPPDNACAFISWLESAGADELKGVRYTVFGCGDRNWAATYQRVPEQIDALMTAKGAKRLSERGEGDASADFEDAYSSWCGNQLWPGVGKAFPLGEESTAAPLLDLKFVPGARAAAVTVNRELQQKDSGRSTRHIEIALPEGVTYLEGDHLAVVPRNPPALVDRVLRRFQLMEDSCAVINGSTSHLPHGRPVTIGTVLRECVELQDAASRQQIRALAAATACPPHKAELEALLVEDTYRADVLKKRVSLLDLLERYRACEIPFEQFLAMLPSLKPRYYSIASSPTVDPRIAAITVAVIREPAWSGNGEYRGVTSNYLAESSENSTIQVLVSHPESGFRLPADPSVPLIMVGPGTGIAPFRGFLQARRKQTNCGAAHLYFGCRHPDQDFLYRDELELAEKDGLVTLHVAFSRVPGEPKTYVQHLMQGDGALLKDLIENKGAYIYVCGDGSQMAPEVEQLLINLLGAPRVEALQREKRYVKDVWAG